MEKRSFNTRTPGTTQSIPRERILLKTVMMLLKMAGYHCNLTVIRWILERSRSWSLDERSFSEFVAKWIRCHKLFKGSVMPSTGWCYQFILQFFQTVSN